MNTQLQNKPIWHIGILLSISMMFFVGFLKNNYKNPPPVTHKNIQVLVTKEGFVPSEITIEPGDTVTFLAKSESLTWPASDPHPSHENLDGFDPKEPIQKEGKWSFTFNQVGVWRYHDHLSPSLRGTITVVNENTTAPGDSSYNSEECKDECFDEEIRRLVKEEGIDAAYNLFTNVYAEGKLPRTCHWTAHQIGEAAYELFREKKDFPITQTTAYCGYGFYHGFLEGLLRENPDVDYVLSFCKEVEKQLGKMGLWNCYHGIGHGFTEDPPDPKVVGNPDAMLAPGIKTCEFIFGSSFQDLNLCLTGVYTVLAGFAEKGEFGITLDENDPFAFCRTQPYKYQKACYGEFIPKIDKLIKGDLTNLPPYLEQISDEKVMRLIAWVMPSITVARDILKPDLSSYITQCKTIFTGRLKDICLGGVVQGIFSHGEPMKQHLKAIPWCQSDLLSKEERSSCFEELFHRLRHDISLDQAKKVCPLVPKEYQIYCLERMHEPAYDDPSFE